MKLSTPRWWYVRDSGHARLTRTLLRPLSWLWSAETARRIAKARPEDAGIRVISIGNLTMGGSGKTPVAREVVRLLQSGGVDAHALSRGYGGKLAGPVQVDPDVHLASEVGDEPLMLALGSGGERLPVWISRDRIQGARAAARQGAAVVVLDDGHQNMALKKSLSLIVVDGETRNDEWPFGDGAVFPSGPMREPLKAGLSRADAVVILLPTDVEAVDAELAAVFGTVPVFVARLTPDGPPPAGPQVGFAGVAKPWKVERSLLAAGCDLKDFAPFADHAPLSEADLEFLADRASLFGAGLVTTEKDWVRLPAPWRARVTAWPVRAVFQDAPALTAFLKGD